MYRSCFSALHALSFYRLPKMMNSTDITKKVFLILHNTCKCTKTNHISSLIKASPTIHLCLPMDLNPAKWTQIFCWQKKKISLNCPCSLFVKNWRQIIKVLVLLYGQIAMKFMAGQWIYDFCFGKNVKTEDLKPFQVTFLTMTFWHSH